MEKIGKKVANYGCLVALAIIFGYVEMLIPFNIGISGIKLGLANIVTVITLFKFGKKSAVYVSFIRVILSGILFGNMSVIIYSLAGTILSIFIMIVLKYTKKFSIIGISAAGGAAHNIGQLIIAVFVVKNISLSYYLPVLMVSGIITGILIGIASMEILKRLK